MQLLNVVVANTDAQAASRLAQGLNGHFRSVAVARSIDEVRRAIPKHRADLAIVDLESVNLEDVAKLRTEFGQTQVMCTHRVPDEEMWAEALTAGAIDCCQNADIAGIIEAVRRNFRQARANAA
jgi:DNA-binding NtrC family response regulator